MKTPSIEIKHFPTTIIIAAFPDERLR